MHHEIDTLRQALKTAVRHGWISHVLDLSPPFRGSGKFSHCAWFSPKEYRQLYEAPQASVAEAKGTHMKELRADLHEYVLFVANTCLRPDKANGLQYHDVEIVKDEASSETILEIELRGKSGAGYCKSTTGAVLPFEQANVRCDGVPTDLVFPTNHKKQFNTVLAEQGLKFDRDGNRRTAYSLRHSCICLGLLEGVDIYQIAKNCRTSVEMIEKHYAAPIKDMIDTSLTNVWRRGR